MRVLALDIGDKRIGVAVSDPLGITAQGLETYTRTGDLDKDTDYLIALANKYKPVRLLFGMHRTEAFPIDVWIKRVLATYYPNGFPEFAAANAGIAQQYLFHYMRNLPENE